MQNWLYAWQRSRGAPRFAGLRPGLADASRRAARGRRRPPRRPPHRRAQPPDAGAVRAAAGRARRSTRRRGPRDAPRRARRERRRPTSGTDGVHRECSTDYHLIVLRSLRRRRSPTPAAAGLSMSPRAASNERRSRCDFALHVQRPDGTTPALSDGDQGDFRTLLAVAADVLDRADLRWAATAGADGTPPGADDVDASRSAATTCSAAAGATAAGRTATSVHASSTAARSATAGHGHYDQLSVELAAGGRAARRGPRSLHLRRGRDRLAPLVQGHRRAQHGDGRRPRPDALPAREAEGAPRRPPGSLGRCTGPGLDVLGGEVRSPCYDAVHTRRVAFVDDDYWVIHDRLRGRAPHRYEARWHLRVDARGTTIVERDRRPRDGRAPRAWCCACRVGRRGDARERLGSPAVRREARRPGRRRRRDGRATATSSRRSSRRRRPSGRGRRPRYTHVDHFEGHTDRIWWDLDAPTSRGIGGPC